MQATGRGRVLGHVTRAPSDAAAGPDREHNVVAVNADALVRLTRSGLPVESPTTSTAFAARHLSVIRHGDGPTLSLASTVNIAEPQ